MLKVTVRKLPKSETCLCPECGHFHGRIQEAKPGQYKLTGWGRFITLCTSCGKNCGKKPATSKKHKDLPGQQMLPFDSTDQVLATDNQKGGVP
jgi:hypothetical protein